MRLTDQLINFASAPPPEDALQMTRLSLLDWSACGIAGARGASFAAFKDGQIGGGSCDMIGGGQGSAPAAALVNGTLSHALDYDDTHLGHIGHPSVAIFPAVLALAQVRNGTLNALTAAAAIGIEASVHVGLWLGRSHYQRGFHQTATAGAFGATLAGARLLGLDAGQTRHALGLCASMASGLKVQFGTMAKPLNAGLAARTGVEATLWAQAGMTAAHDGLEDPQGFGPTHHGEGNAVTIGETPWQIMTISHKFHACCHGLHAMLEALSTLDIHPDHLRQITITTHPRWLSVCNIAQPATGLEAKFSYAQAAAMRLLGYDTGSIDLYTDAITRDPAVIALRDKVKVIADETLAETAARVCVTTDAGDLNASHDLMTPISLEARTKKLRAKAAALLGDDGPLWAAVQGDDLSALIAQLSAR